MKKLTVALMALACLSGTSIAQKISLAQFKNLKPRNIGPAGMSGRITSIDVVVDNPNIIYLGAASGGVWKTENSGNSWTAVFDDQSTQNIGSVAIQQSNPNIVWVGTGEGNPRNSLNLGEGIFKSMDAGKTWKLMGLEKTKNIHRILIDPVNPNTVYAAAIGNPFSSHPERGVYKTTDGGETWSKILYTSDSSGCAELVMDPSNPNKLIACMWQHRRTPWDFKSGGAAGGLYITIDGGKNWKKLGKEEGLPDGNYGRVGLAFASNEPRRVYAMVEATKNGLYKSDDGGMKWELVNSDARWVTNRPFYFQDIRVDTKNENRIYNIHDQVEVSEDGGKTFSTLIPYSGIHPDHHAWWISPKDPNFMIEGNDGGIGITHDRGKNWVFDDKIPAGQFYHVNVDNELPYNIMGGMQDNGTWHGPAYTWINGGIRNYYWNNVGGGDGFDVMPDAEDAGWVYSQSQGGSIGRRNWKTGENWFIRPQALDPSVKLRFNWNSALAQDPFDKKTIYFGSQFVHKSTDKGVSWEIISPDLTTNDSVKIAAYQNTGGLTMDITGAETHCTILTLEPSRKEPGLLWAGTDDGVVQLTRDGGKTWTSFRGKIPGLASGCWIPQIKASAHNAGEAFVVANDYRRGDMKPYIFRTTDYGKTWTRMVDENKVKGYALCVLQDPAEPNLIFVGTENGLWISFDNGASFEQFKNGYPSVSTFDLAIQEREADLAIATFGRALWILDDIRSLRKAAANKGGGFTRAVTILSAPDAYQVQYRPANGYDWSTYGLYEADNRRRGAAVSFFINKPKQDTAAKQQPATPATQPAAPPAQQPGGGRRGRDGGGGGGGRRTDSVTVRIYNSSNEQVRSLRWAVDSGFNKMYWGMEEKGYRQPGSPKPQPGAAEPGGLQVLPGTYKIMMTYAGTSDSAFINIYDDPRIGNRNVTKLAQRRMYDRLRKSSDKLVTGMDQLSESEELLTKIQTQAKGVEGKDADSLRKSTTKMQDEIKAIREFINGKTSDRQGISRSPFEITVMTALQTAQQSIGSKMVEPGPQVEALVVNAEKAVKEAIDKINSFYNSKWKDYRQQVEGTKLNLFKEYKPIE
ncbi:MAG TPA: hypothetical protein PLZ45_01830 [Ferruginibacter sp.]|nr:hypothetical protein [Chitinophagaceae bacterium]HRI23379.1 hypothetical protein [Ferruginibacter sp.]